MGVVSVLKFGDYRSFLKAHAQRQKRENPKWSYGVWARKLRLKATTSLTMILNGQRHPGPKITQEFIRYFKLEDEEKAYFQDLIQLAKIKDNSRLRILLIQSLREKNPKSDFYKLEAEAFSAIANWYHYAVQQLVRTQGFQNSTLWIQNALRFPVSKKEIQDALKAALKLGILKRTQGKLTHLNRSVETTNDIASEALKIFHEQILELSRKSIRSIPVQEREFRSVTLSMRKENIKKAKELIRKFTQEFDDLLSEEGDEVFQLSIQFFPLTQKNKIQNDSKKRKLK